MVKIKHDDFCPCNRFHTQPEFCTCGAVECETDLNACVERFGEKLREINRMTASERRAALATAQEPK